MPLRSPVGPPAWAAEARTGRQLPPSLGPCVATRDDLPLKTPRGTVPYVDVVQASEESSRSRHSRVSLLLSLELHGAYGVGYLAPSTIEGPFDSVAPVPSDLLDLLS